jgi:hypothetical protein
MANLTASRDCKRLIGDEQSDGVLNAVVIYKGSMVFLTAAGYATPTAAAGLHLRGVAQEYVDNSAGSAGDVNVKSMAGVFEFHNSATTDEITIADKGKLCYVVDNQTVAKTDGGGTRAVAGVVKSVSSSASGSKVRVEVGEVAVPASGSDQFALSFEGISSKASDGEVMRWVAPFACRLVKFYTVLNGALATAYATVQAKKGASNIGSTTTGLVTITQAASAAGDVDSASPLLTNVDLAAGDILSFTVAGGSTATATLNLSALLKAL